MRFDPWLTRWLPLLRERVGAGPVLEIGCGQGADTATLVRAGFKVHGIDISATALGIAKSRVPSAILECLDIRDPFPERTTNFGAIIASLSLHYFAWSETERIVQRIHSALAPSGILLCRLNSTADHNFGASGHPEIEPNYFLVKSEPKRFFDKAAIDSLFGHYWRRLSLEHIVTSKYVRPKALWEAVLERADA